ncbi:MAG: formate/nitrite transporter family protein [Oscillospiraceae bacterium]|nr:formate/nitrite transporter family protein [Oscillospiraceae bacterium]
MNIKKWISAIFAGMYIGLGATAYILSGDSVFAPFIFTVGIFLVMHFYDMLFTKVFPYIILGYYKKVDILYAILGNIVGGLMYAFLISNTRILDKILPKIEIMVDTKLSDSYISVFIMSIFCGLLVGYAVLSSKKMTEDKGIAIFLNVIFIGAFVICGFDHVVANIFYYGVYIFNINFKMSMIFNFIIVFIGNSIGGIIVGYSEKYRLKNITV